MEDARGAGTRHFETLGEKEGYPQTFALEIHALDYHTTLAGDRYGAVYVHTIGELHTLFHYYRDTVLQ